MVKNNKGMTLVELLLTITISLSIVGLISNVLIQSFRSKEISDSHVSLRQEANIILSMFSSAQMGKSITTYDLRYKKLNGDDWELIIGNQRISNPNFNILMDMEVGGTKTFVINQNTSEQELLGVDKRQKLNIKKLQLIDKNNKNNTFEISTVFSRM
jgi:prepilin-type N-terminal cleavage/methylation domain-containing protein